MFCEKCGTQIPDDNKFCTNCGAVIGQEAAAAAPAAVAVARKPITLNKKTLTIGGIVIAVIIAAIILINVLGNLPETIALDKYISVEFDGLNSQGYADLDFDVEQLAMDLSGGDQQKAIEIYYLFYQNLELYLDKGSNLSNGDTVTICMDLVEDAFAEFDYKVKIKDDEITVSGLREATVLDLFADLEFTYYGYAPNASVSVSYVGSNQFIIDNVYYYINGGHSLSEGSTFTVEASVSEYTANNEGYILTETSKEYTATNVPQPTVLDVFADLQITYTGCAPYAEAKVEYVGDNEFVKEYVYFYLSNYRNLSEGSVFTVEVSYSEWRAEESGYVIEVTSKDYTASNLPQPVELDVFQFIEVTFTGTEGNGKASYKLVNTDDYFIKYYLNFSFNKSSSLTGGETIALMYSVDSWVDPLQYGYTIPAVTSKQYTVPTLGKEATSFNDLSAEGQAEVLAKLDELTQLYLNKTVTSNKTSSMYLEGTNYSSGNNLSYAAGVENIKLHSVVTGSYTSWWSEYRYMVFVYTFDIIGHPNVAENGGNVTGATMYFYVEDPIATGTGHLEGKLENIDVNTSVYLSYEALEEAFLYKFTTKDVYTAE